MAWTHVVYGTDLYHLIQWFILYSFLGWLVESIYMSFCNRKLTNRGFTFSPFCPIYAVGALSVYAILRPIAHNYFLLYFAGAAVATLLEYVTAVIMQNTLGNVWWDYHEKPFNYKGILCLESTVAWGFYTLILFAFLHGFVEMVTESYSYHTGMFLAAGVIVIYSFDFFLHLFQAKMNRYPKKVEKIRERVMLFIQK